MFYEDVKLITSDSCGVVFQAQSYTHTFYHILLLIICFSLISGYQV